MEELLGCVIVLPESEKMSDWKLCIRRSISETELYTFDEVMLDKIYFINKNLRCLSLIAINGDSGIEQVNLEYPSRQKNGHLSTSRIKLACDWHQKGKIYKTLYPEIISRMLIAVHSLIFLAGHATPQRSSPRLHAASHSPNSQDETCSSISVTTYNIYVTVGVKQSSSVAEGPVHVIHNVPHRENLKYVKCHLREEITDVCLKAGLYWLPKVNEIDDKMIKEPNPKAP